ncbi:hypothetical protein [Reyranella sp.]|uniref:hypothetical protein n=1 Tax=Reyranella sp. TaxID=1929291 RepID=UPI003BABD527
MTGCWRLLPLIAVAGCAVANSAPSSQEVVRLRDIRDACLMRNAVTLDDRRSDPAAVASAVVAACQRQNNALIDAIAGPDGFRRSQIARDIEQNSHQAATQYVLSHRAARARS